MGLISRCLDRLLQALPQELERKLKLQSLRLWQVMGCHPPLLLDTIPPRSALLPGEDMDGDWILLEKRQPSEGPLPSKLPLGAVRQPPASLVRQKFESNALTVTSLSGQSSQDVEDRHLQKPKQLSEAHLALSDRADTIDLTAYSRCPDLGPPPTSTVAVRSGGWSRQNVSDCHLQQPMQPFGADLALSGRADAIDLTAHSRCPDLGPPPTSTIGIHNGRSQLPLQSLDDSSGVGGPVLLKPQIGAVIAMDLTGDSRCMRAAGPPPAASVGDSEVWQPDLPTSSSLTCDLRCLQNP
eukprot:TRINITY_DN25708_c0_g1_i1.p1 TRINITY_DN25708_c0_g1~~TRINITY_DN25708_c0_g1_i1.p1  ORF type:complete len:310 (-),score=43.86 TRINITY_DN25708_c0_g1_i1:5-892(-)